MSMPRRTLGVLAVAAAALGTLAGAAGAQAQAVKPADAGSATVSSISLNGPDLAVWMGNTFYTNDPAPGGTTPAGDEFKANITGLDPSTSVTMRVDTVPDSSELLSATADSNGRATFTFDQQPSGGVETVLTVNGTAGGQNTQTWGYLVVGNVPKNLALDNGTPAGSTVNPSDVSFGAQYAIPGDPVELFVDGTQVGSTPADSSGNVSGLAPTTPLAAGHHTAYVESVDSQGNAGDPSSIFSFDVATTPSAPWGLWLDNGGASSSYMDGAIVNARDVSFDAQGGVPDEPVELFVDGTKVGSTPADSDGNVSRIAPDTPLPTGYHTAYLESVDSDGNHSPPSSTFSFYVAPPAPTVVSPADTPDNEWPYANSNQPTFTVSGVDPGATVTLYQSTDAGLVPLDTVTSAAGGTVSLTPTTPVPDDFDTFTVTQSETEGTGPTQQSVPSDWMLDQTSVHVVESAPTLTAHVSGPTNDSTPKFNGGVDDIGGDANARLRLINADSGQTLGEFSLADGQWTPSTPLPDGRYSVYAVSIDDTGHVGTARSAPVDFRLSTVPPAAPTVITPADGATVTTGDLTITTGGNAEGDYICPVLDAGTAHENDTLDCAQANANGHATFTLSGGLSAGPHTLTVGAFDQYGNWSQTATTFNVGTGTTNPTPPTPPTNPTPPTPPADPADEAGPADDHDPGAPRRWPDRAVRRAHAGEPAGVSARNGNCHRGAPRGRPVGSGRDTDADGYSRRPGSPRPRNQLRRTPPRRRQLPSGRAGPRERSELKHA